MVVAFAKVKKAERGNIFGSGESIALFSHVTLETSVRPPHGVDT